MVIFSAFFWDPDPVFWKMPIIHAPILWYGVLFAASFALSFPIFVRLLARFVGKEKAAFLTDKIVLYVVIGTVVGARVGHFVFYEKPSTYLLKPWELFLPPYAGLASHGALIAIPVALYLFARRYKNLLGGVTWLRLLDSIAVPTALVGAFIRTGNFINQEILGVPTNLPWGVVFGHPADLSPQVPRHPVQLYEAFFYLGLFFFLWALSSRRKQFKEGFVIGIFFIFTFGFRFFIEGLKVEQSHLVPLGFPMTMGQILSIPVIILGIGLLARSRLTR